ncbi:MAG: phytanoyl-CoA dioxygenase, partial [Ilumatobacteraceae bacterium]
FGEAGLPFSSVRVDVPEINALPVDLATGEAGDVYLCHPFLVHAASFPHRGAQPRFMAQPAIVARQDLRAPRRR